jgi:hypothetical protein
MHAEESDTYCPANATFTTIGAKWRLSRRAIVYGARALIRYCELI